MVTRIHAVVLSILIVALAACGRAECVSDSDCEGTASCRDAVCVAEEEEEDEATGCGSNPRVITAEYYGFVDLVTNTVFPEDFSGFRPDEPWDITFAYNAGTEPDPAFAQVNFELNVGWARVDAAFDDVCEAPASFATNPDFIDAPLSSTRSFVIRTHAGTRVKIGAPVQFQQNGRLQLRFSAADFD